MLGFLTEPHSNMMTIFFLMLASFRIWLEIIGFDFLKLPITGKLTSIKSEENLRKFHKMGLIFSIGYIILFAPSLFLGP